MAFALPKLERPAAVIFDWDHTLSNPDESIRRAFDETVIEFAAKGLTLPEATEPPTLATETYKDVDYFTNTPRFLKERFTAQYGAEQGEEAEIAYFANFRKYTAIHTKPMTGALDVLARLQKEGIPVAIVSHKRQGTLDIETQALLGDKFAPLPIMGRHAEFQKPHKACVDMALEQLGLADIDPGKVWVVGDSLESDIHMARNASCVPVWYGKYSQMDHSTDTDAVRVKNHGELQRLISQALGTDLGR